jgi:hypothetical protein
MGNAGQESVRVVVAVTAVRLAVRLVGRDAGGWPKRPAISQGHAVVSFEAACAWFRCWKGWGLFLRPLLLGDVAGLRAAGAQGGERAGAKGQPAMPPARHIARAGEVCRG